MPRQHSVIPTVHAMRIWVLAADAQYPHAPGHAWALNTLGVARVRAGQFAEGLATLKASTDATDGGSPDDWIFVAMAKWHLGGHDKAKAQLERC